jgi:hypothetical protein
MAAGSRVEITLGKEVICLVSKKNTQQKNSLSDVKKIQSAKKRCRVLFFLHLVKSSFAECRKNTRKSLDTQQRLNFFYHVIGRWAQGRRGWTGNLPTYISMRAGVQLKTTPRLHPHVQAIVDACSPHIIGHAHSTGALCGRNCVSNHALTPLVSISD